MHDVVHRIVRPDGTIRYVHELASYEHTDDDSPYMIGTVQDITDIKQAEANLEMFARVFDATDQGIGVTDHEGIVVYINKACASMLGYTQEQMLGHHFSEYIVPEYRNRVEEIIEEVYAGHSWVNHLPLQRVDGSTFVSLSNIGAVTDSGRRVQYLFNIFTDISKELERQEELKRARDEAEQANQAKSQFLSSMSHELRTPMNAILGFSQLLEADPEINDSQRDSINEIMQAGRHLLELINEVLDLARIESGTIEISPKKIDLKAVVDECLGLSRPLAMRRGVEIQVSDFQQLHVWADQIRLKQVLVNLISNAIKYNREEGRVFISAYSIAPDRVRVDIRDTGVGLDETQREKLFQPFVRLVTDASPIEGSGIGLVISQQLVELMGGDIGVDSVPGEGSTFWIELPDARTEQPMLPAPASGQFTPLHPLREGFERPVTVLHIEDNASNRKLISSVLSPVKNLELRVAESGYAGLDQINAQMPDLVLLDINMPGMNGYEFLLQFRQQDPARDVPVIAVSASATSDDIRRGLDAGFDAYLTKPLRVHELLMTLERFLASEE